MSEREMSPEDKSRENRNSMIVFWSWLFSMLAGVALLFGEMIYSVNHDVVDPFNTEVALPLAMLGVLAVTFLPFGVAFAVSSLLDRK